MEYLLISDAAKRVQVESHVLRYWEEELKLPIKRNEAGHRYYTDKDIERFLQIKSMKERGLQLKAIKMILKDGKLDVLPMGEAKAELGEIETWQDVEEQPAGLAIDIVPNKHSVEETQESKEEKAQRLQWLLKQLIKETLQENNRELCKEIREGVVKELDYQFRCQEERETEREKQRELRNEEYYQRMDELLRKKSSRLGKEKTVKGKFFKEKAVKEKSTKANAENEMGIKDKHIKNKDIKIMGDSEMPSTKAAEAKEQLMKEIQAKEAENFIPIKEVEKSMQDKVLPIKKKRHLFS